MVLQRVTQVIHTKLYKNSEELLCPVTICELFIMQQSILCTSSVIHFVATTPVTTTWMYVKGQSKTLTCALAIGLQQ